MNNFKQKIFNLFQNKVFLPLSISLLAVVIIVASLTSSGLIGGANKEKQLVEKNGESVTKTPTPTITPGPTIKLIIKPTVSIQPLQEYVAPTPTVTPAPTITQTSQALNQQTQSNQEEVSQSNDLPVPTAPKDSQGNLCWSTASRCKYECNDADGWIDVWVDNISFYTDQSKFTTDPVQLQSYKDQINERVAKLTNSCGEAKVRQWVQ